MSLGSHPFTLLVLLNNTDRASEIKLKILISMLLALSELQQSRSEPSVNKVKNSYFDAIASSELLLC
jgi:hypothetical protein